MGEKKGVRKFFTMKRGSEDRPVHTEVDKAVQIEEGVQDTGGHYAYSNIKSDIGTGVNTITEKVFQFPFAISLLSANFRLRTIHDGDEVEFVVGEDTIIGACTIAHSIGDTVINVTQTVVDNIRLGGYIQIDSDVCDRCVGIDIPNKQITIETALTSNISAGKYVKMTVKPIPYLYLECEDGDRHNKSIGLSKVGGSYVPANTQMKVLYKNVDGLAKTFVFDFDYLY